MVEPKQRGAASRLLATMMACRGDEELLWKYAHELRSSATGLVRQRLIKFLESEPLGDRQAALLEAIEPGADVRYLRIIERIVTDRDERFSSDTKEIAASHLAFAGRNRKRARTLLLRCLKDPNPAVRMGGLRGAYSLLSDVRLWLGVERLTADATKVRSGVVGEWARQALNDHMDELCDVFRQESERSDCAFPWLVDLECEQWSLQGQIERMRLERQFSK